MSGEISSLMAILPTLGLMWVAREGNPLFLKADRSLRTSRPAMNNDDDLDDEDEDEEEEADEELEEEELEEEEWLEDEDEEDEGEEEEEEEDE